MSRVEVFATWIKIESRDQSPFKGIKVASKQQNFKESRCTATV